MSTLFGLAALACHTSEAASFADSLHGPGIADAGGESSSSATEDTTGDTDDVVSIEIEPAHAVLEVDNGVARA